MPVLYSDIKVYCDGQLIRSHNIDGRTVIYVDDFVKIYPASPVWSNEDRTLRLTINPPQQSTNVWVYKNINPYYDNTIDSITKGFSFEMENQSEGDEINFKMSGYGGDYKAIDAINVSNKGISFSIYQQVKVLGDVDGLRSCANIVYGSRLYINAPERREALSKKLRVYINDTPVNGELAYSQGNGHSDFQFNYDEFKNINEIQTLRIEVGSQIKNR